MNAQEKKTLILLLGILAALGVAFLIIWGVNRSNTKKAEAAAAASAQSNVVSSQLDFTALTWKNPKTTLSFQLGDDGNWFWVDDPDFPMEQSHITNMISLLSNLVPQQTIEKGDTLEAYGLADPPVVLTATQRDGTQMTFSLGNATTEGNGYYLLTSQSDTVYIVGNTLHTELSRGIYDLIILPDFPTLTADNLKSVAITGAVSSTLTAVRTVQVPDASSSAAASSSSSAAETTTAWFLNGKDRSDNDTVKTLVSELTGLAIASCADYQPTDEAAALCGFDAPACTLNIVYTDDAGADQTVTLTVGRQNAAGDGYYVRLGGGDTNIYNVSSDALKTALSVAASGVTG